MIYEEIIGLLRRKINETDLEISDLTDEELLLVLKDAAGELGARRLGVFNNDAITVITDQTDPNYGISPELSVPEGHILATKAALMILQGEYNDRISRGVLGISWRSGLEEMSTIAASGSWKIIISGLESRLEELILIHRSKTAGTRTS